ncbi:MAG: hydrogenase maturation protease [Actinobacteria bacterium]|nr:hydrogenase maturation protease [Actinomycetota bacterium]
MTGPQPPAAQLTGRMLIAGVGNIFLRDDGFGPAVAKRLATVSLPAWVRVADYGISGMHLAYDLADGYDAAILVDAAPRGDKPGTVTVLAPAPPPRPGLDVTADGRPGGGPAAETLGASRLFDAHGMQPDVVLGVLDMLGATAARILVVGCEPASVDYGMELSEPVANAVDEAVQVILDLVAKEGVSHVPWHSR